MLLRSEAVCGAEATMEVLGHWFFAVTLKGFHRNHSD